MTQPSQRALRYDFFVSLLLACKNQAFRQQVAWHETAEVLETVTFVDGTSITCDFFRNGFVETRAPTFDCTHLV